MSEELRTKEQQFRAVPVKGLTVPWKWSVQRRVLKFFWREIYWCMSKEEAQEVLDTWTNAPHPKPQPIYPRSST